MNILAVGAHPDDVETMCAGTLAKYAAQGHKVFIATATNGNIGSAHHTMEEIGRIRKQEAANSAAIIGAEYICLDYDDEMFFEIDRETRLKFINLVRHCKADVIFTHNPHDYNPDHMLTSKIINDIAVMIPIAHLKTEEPPYNVIPSIWYFAVSYTHLHNDAVDILVEQTQADAAERGLVRVGDADDLGLIAQVLHGVEEARAHDAVGRVILQDEREGDVYKRQPLPCVI